AKGGRKMMKLPVSAPFHSPLMEPAQAHMTPVLAALEFKAPVCPLVNNVDAKLVTDPAQLRDGLVRQIPGAVRWEAIIRLLLAEGVTTFLELGPGKVLSGIAGRMAKEAGIEIKASSIGTPEDMAALVG
ncbi:MAG: malonyl CoA-acyl carrier protein transacylase, partial [Holophaga sp.]